MHNALFFLLWFVKMYCIFYVLLVRKINFFFPPFANVVCSGFGGWGRISLAMGKGGVEREGCDQREMSEQRPPPGSHLPCPVKSLPSCAPGCSLLPLGPGSLLPPRRPGWEMPLSLLVVSLPCWMCFSCPAGTASSTETHPGCGMGSPAGFFFSGEKGTK